MPATGGAAAPNAKTYTARVNQPVAPAVPVVDPNFAAMLQFLQRQQAPAPPPVPQAPQFQPVTVMPDYGPQDAAMFDALQSRLNNQYAEGMNDLDYQQGVFQQNAGMQREDLNRRFTQMRDKLPGQYQGRGLLNSGIYQQGLQDYGQQASYGLTDFENRVQQQLGGFNRQRQKLGSAFSTGTAETEAQRAARRSQVAATVRAII